MYLSKKNKSAVFLHYFTVSLDQQCLITVHAWCGRNPRLHQHPAPLAAHLWREWHCRPFLSPSPASHPASPPLPLASRASHPGSKGRKPTTSFLKRMEQVLRKRRRHLHTVWCTGSHFSPLMTVTVPPAVWCTGWQFSRQTWPWQRCLLCNVLWHTWLTWLWQRHLLCGVVGHTFLASSDTDPFSRSQTGGGGGWLRPFALLVCWVYFYFFMWASNFGVGRCGHIGIQKQHNVESWAMSNGADSDNTGLGVDPLPPFWFPRN